jgi:hypothetical protein
VTRGEIGARNITRDLTDLLLRPNRLIDCDFDPDVTPEEIDEHLKWATSFIGSKPYCDSFFCHFEMTQNFVAALSL